MYYKPKKTVVGISGNEGAAAAEETAVTDSLWNVSNVKRETIGMPKTCTAAAPVANFTRLKSINCVPSKS